MIRLVRRYIMARAPLAATVVTTVATGAATLATLTTLLLSACATEQQESTRAALVQHTTDLATVATAPLSAKPQAVKGSSQHAQQLAQQQAAPPVLRHTESLFIGNRTESTRAQDRLPPVFTNAFQYYSATSLSIEQVINQVQTATGVLIRLAPDASSAPTALSGQSGTTNDANTGKNGLPMAFSGSLSSFLNQVCHSANLSWSYDNGSVMISRLVSQTYEVASLVGTSSYKMSSGSTASGSGNAQQSADARFSVDESGSIDALANLVQALEKMVSGVPGSSVLALNGSSQVLVRTSDAGQQAVAALIAAQNQAMLKQALIQFDVYSVQTDSTDENGINWQVALNALSNVYGLTVASPAGLTGPLAGQAGVTILRGDSTTSRRFANSSGLLTALHQVGSHVQHRIVPMMALNGHWASNSDGETRSYIAETTPGVSTATGPGTPGIKSDKVATGDRFQVLPHILGNNDVILRIGVSLSDLLDLTNVSSGVGNNQQTIQSPHVHATTQQYTVRVAPGEVVAITGLSRLVHGSSERRLGEGIPLAAGGSIQRDFEREHVIILARVVLL